MNSLFNQDCSETLKTLENNSIDALITDPPAGISFMGKSWDSDKGGRDEWIKWMCGIMKECHRVMKPGAHGLVWSIPRTSHWTATALENAGFEIRDVVSHLFGQGFPKSLNISKAIDKMAGAERKIIGEKHCGLHHRGGVNNFTDDRWKAENRNGDFVPVTAPSTKAAKQWHGWGTALKPAVEMWWLIRKPCSEKTVASNVLKWGTGGINIDGCRIEGKPRTTHQDGNYQSKTDKKGKIFDGYGLGVKLLEPQGRFPANLVLSHSEYCTDEMCDIECAVALLNVQSAAMGMHSAGNKKTGKPHKETSSMFGIGTDTGAPSIVYNDINSSHASRFFYCAKISPSERNAGLEEVTNKHPTVKPQKLMRYLCKLITPSGGVVLDPFMGSGSTGMAALAEGFQFVGIESEQEYYDIAKKRIEFSIDEYLIEFNALHKNNGGK